jgi:inositol polyphosphate 5-phosphatase INPP5B/F
MLCIFAEEKHVPHIKRVAGSTAGVGVMGMMGNKGGAVIRLQLHDTTLCFVAAHLAAHRDNVAGRNADFANIIQKTQFEQEPPTKQELEEMGEIAKLANNEGAMDMLSGGASGDRTFGILDHDFVFYIGDFNYRIVEGITTDEVFARVEAGDLAWLRENDQLNVERENGNVFQGFQEGFGDEVPPFEPTYKFQPKTSLYERRPDKKLRAPAWCDRILWLAKKFDHIEQLSYKSTMDLRISDHKPVSALFQAKCKTVVVERKRNVYLDVIRMLDRWENDSLPKVELEGASVSFGPVRYLVESQASVWISNTSQVIAHWRFTPKFEETALCKRWLHIEPTYGMLIPGERAEIVIRALVDNETAQDLNGGKDTLQDIIVLHLENGPDKFIDVSGEYARSCFGCTLEELVCTTEPIRNVPIASSPDGHRHFSSTQNGATLSVPKELWRMVDAIYQRGLQERNLFLTQGNPAEVQTIRESVDTGTEFDACSVYSMADALWSFLNSLADPVIPPSLFPNMEIDAQSIQPWSRRFLEQLPPVNYNVFVYMISFFREVLLHSEANRLTPAKLAVVCCNCMVKSESEDNDEREMQRKHSLQLIISHFLTVSQGGGVRVASTHAAHPPRPTHHPAPNI